MVQIPQVNTLLVNSFTEADSLLACIGVQHQRNINYQVKRVYDIALELLLLYRDTSFEVLSVPANQSLVEKIVVERKLDNKFLYFKNTDVTHGFIDAMQQMISNLRLDGWESNHFPFNAFVSKEKAMDIQQLLQAYEETLVEHEWFDEARLYKESIPVIEPEENTYCLAPTLTLSYLGMQFVERLPVENLEGLPLYQIANLEIPSSLHEYIKWEESSPWINFWRDNPMQMDAYLYRSTTKELEIQEAFHQIHRNTFTLEETAWLYPDDGSYEPAIQRVLEEKNIPFTCANGVPVLNSKPGRLLQGLIKWAQSRYSASKLCALLRENLLDVENPQIIAKYIERADIRWESFQYEKKLSQLLNETTEEKQIERIRETRRLVRSFFRYLPVSEENLDLPDLLRKLTNFMQKYSVIESPVDEAAQQKIFEYFEQISIFSASHLSLNDMFERITESLGQLRVVATGSKPNRIHLAPLSKGVFVPKKNVHIFGMAQDRAPSQVREDPLLLDKERRAMERRLLASGDKMKEQWFWLTQLIVQQEGKRLSISYTAFDIMANRSVFPSSFFIQAFRKVYDQTRASLTEIEKVLPIIDGLSEENWTEEDVWRQSLEKGRGVQLAEDAKNLYQLEMPKDEYRRARQEEKITEYEGYVPIAEGVYDPRLNHDLVMSAGSLELLGKCPYAYFFDKVLNLRKKEMRDYDPENWLDEAERGTLLHKLYEHYGREAMHRKNPMTLKEFESYAEKELAVWKEENPPPSEHIYEETKQKILRSCRIFYQNEQENDAHRVQEVEYEFGFEDSLASINLSGDAALQLRGKIDRIEESGEQELRVLDYKTGKPSSRYSSNKPFHGGRMLQHYLYMKALKDTGTFEQPVVETGYYFPSDRGYGSIAIHEVNHNYEERGDRVLNRLLDIIKYGEFFMTDDKMDCTYCDFTDVCKRTQYSNDMLNQKRQNGGSLGTEAFNGVRSID
ncbi:PD-(D/E)XK nuclease family protein [Natribacillus halophilus]|uniref:PD-(D/E)XK nuclease superfamily protein n=1 Tax=Natribacillus halophilus TaxID=549003 RepID=A0A1G8LB18_9BACI|nr:PD-(D/E)XK nuclease family protein [Natribacillus halophilus]SDI52872.1 PD-(D/E)XK nuclease superfamily protein [Natribacillus halophilus]